MATKVKWTHVYEDVPEGDETIRTYVGFFVERKDAEQWVKKQKNRKLELSDKRPVLPERVAKSTGIAPPEHGDDVVLVELRSDDTTTKDTTAAAVDEALTTAIAAAKAEEAPHAVPPAGKAD